jgi:hypothetical protein
MRKEFSPLPRTSHMVDDLSTESFVFLGGVGFVEDAVMFMRVKTDTSK